VRGDERFDEFYQRGYRRLVGQLFLLTGDLHDAEDIAQEAFTRAAARWEQIRGHDVPAAWVRRVAINLATDTARRARRRLAALSRLGEPPVVPALRAEEVALIEALRRLPMRYREAVVLHHLVDLTVEQVAAHLGVPVGTVKTRLARGRAALARELQTEPAGEPRSAT
jgi:RNA polymerase sigma-70 factor (ECF subfamily)